MFITGGTGVGKSYLMKTISMFLTKTMNLNSGSSNKSKVLFLAPTRVVAIHINGTTINSGLSISPNVNGYTLLRFSDSERARLCNLYLEVPVVIIDEISMVSNIGLLHIHKPLREIFGCPEYQPFADLSIIVVSDLLQLPPIKSSQIFEKYNSDSFNLWSLFLMAQFTEVIRQKGDKTFIGLLNNISVGESYEDNMEQLQLRKIDLNSVPLDATVIFAENKLKDGYNAYKLSQLNHFEIKVEAIDLFPGTVPIHLQTSLSSRSYSGTAGLPLCLKLQKGAPVMIISNIDSSDGLDNGQFGIVFDFGYLSSSITKVYLKLDDEKGGKNSILKDPYASKHTLVPIQEVEANIKTNKCSLETFKRT